jgi:hypothetical protein
MDGIVSICFLIASVGRPSLKNSLRSLYGQFAHGIDKIIVFFDGKCEAGLDYFKEEQELYGNDLEMTLLPKNLGYWGHGIRNRYMDYLPCDYIHHYDDDDAFYPDMLPGIRQDIKDNFGKIIVYKFKNWNNDIIWKTPEIRGGQVGTSSGFLPNRPEIFGKFGYEYGGDATFWYETQDKIGKDNIVFKPTVILECRPKA